jgi:hypothetical protein
MDRKSSGVGGDLRIKQAPSVGTNIVRGKERRAPAGHMHSEMKPATITGRETCGEMRDISHLQAKHTTNHGIGGKNEEDVFWDVAPCSLVETDRRFGVLCLHHQSGHFAPSQFFT